MGREPSNKIVTVEKVEDGRITLNITDHHCHLREGERFKIVQMEDGFQLRRLEPKCDPLERIWMDKECGEVFQIVKQHYPESTYDMKKLQLVMQRSYLYIWMKRLSEKMGIEAEDLQPLLALYSSEIEEYHSVMEALKNK